MGFGSLSFTNWLLERKSASDIYEMRGRGAKGTAGPSGSTAKTKEDCRLAFGLGYLRNPFSPTCF